MEQINMGQWKSIFARAALLLLVPLTGAQAAIVSTGSLALLPADSTVIEGEGLSLALWFDAEDAPGARPGLFGGQIVIDFDPLVLSFSGFTPEGGVTLFSAPVIGSSAGRQTVTLGFENAPELGVVGMFEFLAVGSPGTASAIGLADADEFFGSFISYVPTNQPFYPSFTGASMSIIPLPAAAWLMGSALGLLACWRRQMLTARSSGMSHAG